MLSSLFRRLTTDAGRGAALFAAVTALSRQPHWYVEGKVPDTLDGRFAVLATVAALTTARLEQFGEDGDRASAGLTERFVEVMESEHRELGIGDPSLARQVRKLVGSLGRRVGLWRDAVAGGADWAQVTSESLYKDKADPSALRHSSAALQRLWKHLELRTVADLIEGKIN
jgi:cytochrome b pre-mRNA-processing protein 3